MTSIAPPPEGWEIMDMPDSDEPLDPARVVFVGPEGETMTLAEMVASGRLNLSEADDSEGKHTTIMVALYPKPEVAAALAIRNGASADSLHVTLAFCGEAAGKPKDKAIAAVEAWAKKTAPFEGTVGGIGYFFGNPDSHDGTVTYASVDIGSLPAAREDLVGRLDRAGVPAFTNHGFTPHLTLDYASRRPTLDLPMPIAFDRVTLAWSEQHFSFPLGGTS